MCRLRASDVSFVFSITCRFRLQAEARLKKFFEQRAQTARDTPERPCADRAYWLADVVAVSVHHEANRSGERGTVHVIGQSADTGRRPAANRQIEDLLGNLGDPLEHGPAA